jgi:cell shape-determining protein MreC
LGGVQLRGKNAATLQLLFLAVSLFINIIKVLWYISISVTWFIFLAIKWFVDFLIGFYKGSTSNAIS